MKAWAKGYAAACPCSLKEDPLYGSCSLVITALKGQILPKAQTLLLNRVSKAHMSVAMK